MAETPKREREETLVTEEGDDPKRYKSYSHIISLLEEEEDEPNQDFSSIMTTLQRELSSDSSTFDDPLSLPSLEIGPDGDILAAASSSGSSEFSSAASNDALKGDEEEDERERVIRHLLEASDDDLGIPNTAAGGDAVAVGGDAVALCDGLWELEDEAANYYALLQSELFM